MNRHLQKFKLRKHNLWIWRYQWSIISVTATALVIYNVLAIMWLLRSLSTCSLPFTAPLPAKPCEPCAKAGRPANDDPLAGIDLRLGRWDYSRTIRMFDNVAVGQNYVESSLSRRVCLATQTSIERLHELLQIAEHWSGPISVAVYVAADETRLLRGFATWLLRCRPEMFARLAFHLATPVEHAATWGGMPTWARDCSALPLPASKLHNDMVTRGARIPYPQNHLRNLARKNCHTDHVFLVDVDIVPSRGMAEALDKFLSTTSRCDLCAYVVPTYELDHRVPLFPRDKSELVRLARKKLAVPFHLNVFSSNQYSSNFSRWEASGGNESSHVHVSHDVTNFEVLYEPFYVALDVVPQHDERFLGYGFTRNTQVYEMFMIGYQFRVLSPIFTIHWGLQTRRNRPLWREKQNKKNMKRFETFKRELLARLSPMPTMMTEIPKTIEAV